MVRLSDVAARAGTSVSTVSIVLGDRPSPVRISEATRRAVLDAARELGYTPNLAARRLRSNGVQHRTLVLGIAFPMDSRLSLISRIVAGVQRQIGLWRDDLEAMGVTVQLLIETFDLGKLAQLRGLAEALWFNGLIITNTSPEDDAFLEHLTPAVPIVLFQRYTRHSAVNTDNAVVGRLATTHLLDLGHRRIALIHPTAGSQAQSLRVQGYREAMQQAGQLAEAVHEAASVDWAGGAYATARGLLALPPRQRPTAIFATNDLLAIGVMRAAHERGVRIPESLSVVSCDDAEFAAYQEPPLTTVRLPIEEMAARAATILLDLIYQRATPPVQEMFPSTLVVRGSTGAVPGGE